MTASLSTGVSQQQAYQSKMSCLKGCSDTLGFQSEAQTFLLSKTKITQEPDQKFKGDEFVGSGHVSGDGNHNFSYSGAGFAGWAFRFGVSVT